MKKLKQTLKSYKFWVAVSCCIVLIVDMLSEIIGFKIDRYLMISLLSSVCMILISMGVISAENDITKDEIKHDIEDGLDLDKDE